MVLPQVPKFVHQPEGQREEGHGAGLVASSQRGGDKVDQGGNPQSHLHSKREWEQVQSFTPRLYHTYVYMRTCLISRQPYIRMPHAGGSRTNASTHPTCPAPPTYPPHLPRPAPPTCTRDMAAKAFTAIRARPGSPTDQARPHVPTIDEAVSTPWGGRGLLGN